MKKHLPNTIKLHETLFSLALQLTDDDPHLAQELLQATMQHIIQPATTYLPTTSFTSWAKTIMENTYHTTIKAGDIQLLHHQCHRSPSHTATPQDDDTYNIKEAIYIMSKLSPQQAAVITLRLQGYAHSQIAHKMNITTHNVNTHILQAQHILNHVWDN